MKVFILSLLSFLYVTVIFSQNVTFDWAGGAGGSGATIYSEIQTTFDQNQYIYNAGRFYGTVDFNPGVGVSTLTATSPSSYVQKLSPSGGFEWALKIGGSQPYSVTVDSYGNIIVVGDFYGTVDFDPGIGVYNLVSENTNGANFVSTYILKLSPSGSFIWAKRIGGTIQNGYGTEITPRKVILDTDDNIYLCGQFSGQVDFDPSATTSLKSGNKAGFIQKLDSLGTLEWASVFNHSGSSVNNSPVNEIAIDSNQNVFFVGYFFGTMDFDPSPNNFYLTAIVNSFDISFGKLNSDGSLNWVHSLGTTGMEYGFDLALINNQTPVISGRFSQTIDLDPSSSVVNLSPVNANDGFIASYDTNGLFGWGQRAPLNIADISVFNSKVWALGQFSGTQDFDTSSVVDNETSQGLNDIFLSTYSFSGSYSGVTTIGGTGSEVPYQVNFYSGNLHISGTFEGTCEFDPTSNNYFMTSVGSPDLFTVRLSLCSNSFDTLTLSSCDSLVLPSGVPVYNSGVYSDTVANSGGCDSIISITANISNSSFSTVWESVCDSFVLASGLPVYASGNYVDTVSNSVGCDSIISYNIVINNSTYATITPTSCNSFTSPSGSYFWNVSGTYFDTIGNMNGCDSIITIQLTILDSTSSEIFPSSCNEYVAPDGQTYTTSGIYTSVIPNFVGCDSVITIHLSVIAIDSTITINGYTLESNESNASYQWYNCKTGYPISGATSQQFTPLASGEYMVEITKDLCTATSECELVLGVGMLENAQSKELNLFPNPVEREVWIITNEPFSYQVNNANGTVVAQGKSTQSKAQVDLSFLPTGIYFIKIESINNLIIRKIIKR